MSRAPRQSSAGEPKNPIESTPGESSGDALTFENALAELERLVEQMEGGDLSLEQSLAAHKRGLELARFCQDRLESAQQQVKVLEGDVLKSLSASRGPDAAAIDDSDD